MQQLPGLPQEIFPSVSGISGDGLTIVGGRNLPLPMTGYRWTLAGGTQSFTAGLPLAVNGDGSVVVGNTSVSVSVVARSFVWNSTTGTTLIDPPGTTFSEATAVNPSGTVVAGDYRDPAGVSGAYRWTAATGSVRITPVGIATGIQVTGMSADGNVLVGGGFNDRAFVWTPELGAVDLRTYLIGRGVTGLGGYLLRSASAVSGDGRVIVGFGEGPDHRTISFYATIPTPGALVVTAAGFGWAGRRRRAVQCSQQAMPAATSSP